MLMGFYREKIMDVLQVFFNIQTYIYKYIMHDFTSKEPDLTLLYMKFNRFLHWHYLALTPKVLNCAGHLWVIFPLRWLND